ncbi:MAG: nucleoside monophosphate kinase [Gammaproteobacteria bacterium]|nr:nucleoside monophosphate kinase [Gammaproteobacteria bacterium]
MRIVLLGAPGAGKRTQAALLAEKYNVPQLHLEQLVDAAMASGSDVGKQIKHHVAKREPLPTEALIKVVEQRFREAGAKRGFILNGYPRSIPQAQELDNRLTWFGRPLQIALMMQVDLSAMTKRSRRRSETTLRNQLATYEDEIRPVVTYYRAQQKLRTVIAVGSVEEVFHKICDIIDTDIRPLSVKVFEVQDVPTAVTPAAKPVSALGEGRATKAKAQKAASGAAGKKKAAVAKKVAKAKPSKKKPVKKKPTKKKKPIKKKKPAKKSTAVRKKMTKKTVRKASKKSSKGKKAASKRSRKSAVAKKKTKTTRVKRKPAKKVAKRATKKKAKKKATRKRR